MKYFVYVLQSEKDFNFYIGFTKNLSERLEEHNNGRVYSTAKRIPLKVVYYEVCFDQSDAIHREKYLKSSYGKRYIKSRLKHYLTG